MISCTDDAFAVAAYKETTFACHALPVVDSHIHHILTSTLPTVFMIACLVFTIIGLV